jgi:ribonuclease HII
MKKIMRCPMSQESKAKGPTEKELAHLEQMLAHEKMAWQQGFRLVAGVDEAGRGPLAGPVVSAACILDPARPIYGLNDSKKLTPAARNRLYKQIIEQAVAWQTGVAGPDIIDQINIYQATCRSMRQAIRELAVQPDLMLIDAVKLTGLSQPVWPIIHGDNLSASIAAASILAKVTRDRLMDEFDQIYPEYGFGQHKGYGTPVHLEALLRCGPCPIHRQSFLQSIRGDLARRGFKVDSPAGLADSRQVSLDLECEDPRDR